MMTWMDDFEGHDRGGAGLSRQYRDEEDAMRDGG